MPGNSIGSAFRVTTWGESHGRGVGVVIDGCPAGLFLSSEDVQKELDRRRPGQSKASTARDEADRVEILSGIFDCRTTGCPISMLVWNKDAQSKSYDALRDRPRPGHADLVYQQKYGIRDHRGGGRASARETVGRVAAGAVAKMLLSLWGVDILGYVLELGGIEAGAWDWQKRGEISKEEISRLREAIEANPVRSPDKADEMLEAIEKARMDGESLGGIVQIIAVGVPPGLGEPVFSKLDADLASALMSIGAVKAVEIGAGVASARLRGSEMNDSILPGAKGPAYES
ncbi:MAG: chorismate synthase, partial [Methanotrichaceae archaeon]|nr:chorismate synthase [Methanotrichaceae archaeon]